MRSSSPPGVSERVGDRVRALQRRDDALEAGQGGKCLQRLAVGDGGVVSAATVTQPGVLGAAAGVVKTSRDRVRFEDLTVLVLHDSGVGAVQDTRRTGDRERRSVAAGVDALPRRLDPDQGHVGVVDEGGEDADRVRPTADARQHAVGQPSLALEDLGPGLVPDHALKIAHEGGIGRRSDARADDVVGRLHVCHPVADRRRDCLLERARAGLDGLHAGPEQPHALDVGLLAAHVLGPHVDDALEVEQGAGSRRRRPRAGRRPSRR